MQEDFQKPIKASNDIDLFRTVLEENPVEQDRTVLEDRNRTVLEEQRIEDDEKRRTVLEDNQSPFTNVQDFETNVLNNENSTTENSLPTNPESVTESEVELQGGMIEQNLSIPGETPMPQPLPNDFLTKIEEQLKRLQEQQEKLMRMQEEKFANISTPPQAEPAREVQEENFELLNENMTIEPRQHNPQKGFGGLVVQTVTANGLIPVAGTKVIVSYDSRDENFNHNTNTPGTGAVETNVIAIEETNKDGKTEKIEIETPNKSFSQQPSDVNSFVLLDVLVSKEGFYSIQVKNVQIFPGTTTLQTVNMLPKPDFAANDLMIYDIKNQDL